VSRIALRGLLVDGKPGGPTKMFEATPAAHTPPITAAGVPMHVPVPFRWPRAGRLGLALGLGLLAATAIPGCADHPERKILTDAQLQERSLADTAEMKAVITGAVDKVTARAERALAADPSEPPTIHFLAMSGGGDYGAFGAGFLVGWGNAMDPAARRPDFDAVTGVSTGALLAPFAYVGTDEACLQVETFYRNPKDDWVRDRGMFFFLPSNPSFMTLPGLERDLRSAIDAKFIAQMADRSRAGKVLAVSATDLDLGRQRYWELGKEAEAAEDGGDPDRVVRILMSSAAIPAVFPPVEIGDSVYADGGVTANVFLRLDVRDPSSMVPRWNAAHPNGPPLRIRYWIIVNNQLNSPPKTVQAKWPSIMGPSLATAIRSATLVEVRWLAAQADYVNVQYGTDIEVRMVGIPDEWRPPVEGDFKKETMVSLSELGRKLGADPTCWKLLATPDRPAAGGK
jgi:hypothetical protein